MPKDRFNQDEKNRILAAIKAAELTTSGEIRVHLELHCRKERILDRAAAVFAKLDMHKTVNRNGVLIYVALDDHKFAIIGDAGINSRVPGNFWESTRELMEGHFSRGAIIDGLEEGIRLAGEQLSTYFPYRGDDVNELPDDISFGEEK